MVSKINPAYLFGREEVFTRVSQDIAPNDSMLEAENVGHYLTVGASASAIIHEGLATAGVDPYKVKRVLDYACGYGRVLRWLIADFPNAKVVGVDADPSAAVAAAEVLGVDARPLDLALSQPIDDPFDLIWVGSLFTHLPANEVLRVLGFLRRHLTDSGLLLFTTCGETVSARLKKRERSYGLDDAGVERVLQSLSETGYGYAGYPHSPDYGISVARPSFMMDQLESTGLAALMFKARGWAAHQDVYVCRASS